MKQTYQLALSGTPQNGLYVDGIWNFSPFLREKISPHETRNLWLCVENFVVHSASIDTDGTDDIEGDSFIINICSNSVFQPQSVIVNTNGTKQNDILYSMKCDHEHGEVTVTSGKHEDTISTGVYSDPLGGNINDKRWIRLEDDSFLRTGQIHIALKKYDGTTFEAINSGQIDILNICIIEETIF